jgi:uncharacterized DUF497 family protein
MRLNGLDFTWDDAKALSNIAKHGVTFFEAATAFADPLALYDYDPDHSADEERQLLLGMSHRQRLLIVCYTERGPSIRLISARCASRQEIKDYEKN